MRESHLFNPTDTPAGACTHNETIPSWSLGLENLRTQLSVQTFPTVIEVREAMNNQSISGAFLKENAGFDRVASPALTLRSTLVLLSKMRTETTAGLKRRPA